MLDWRLKGSLDPKDKDQRRQFSNRDGGKTRWTRKLKDKNEDLLIILLETRKPGLLDEVYLFWVKTFELGKKKVF